jgi:hypothetical protein
MHDAGELTKASCSLALLSHVDVCSKLARGSFVGKGPLQGQRVSLASLQIQTLPGGLDECCTPFMNACTAATSQRCRTVRRGTKLVPHL